MSVARAIGTTPEATATAEPELEPPETMSLPNTLRGMPYGERTPTRPVANWSRLVLPTTIAPASRTRCTAVADSSGTWANSGQALVVGRPATSMLSLTAIGTP